MCAPPTPTHRQVFVLCGIFVSPLCISFIWYYLCHVTALLLNGSSHQLAPLMCARRPHLLLWITLYTNSDPPTPMHRQDFILCGIFACLFHTSSACYYLLLPLSSPAKCAKDYSRAKAKWGAQTSEDVKFENPAWDKQAYPKSDQRSFLFVVTECIYRAYIDQ